MSLFCGWNESPEKEADVTKVQTPGGGRAEIRAQGLVLLLLGPVLVFRVSANNQLAQTSFLCKYYWGFLIVVKLKTLPVFLEELPNYLKQLLLTHHCLNFA
jgi:hypothetical protein